MNSNLVIREIKNPPKDSILFIKEGRLFEITSASMSVRIAIIPDILRCKPRGTKKEKASNCYRIVGETHKYLTLEAAIADLARIAGKRFRLNKAIEGIAKEFSNEF